MAKQWPQLPELVKQVESGEVSATQLVERSLKLLEQDKQYLTSIEVNEQARARAGVIDRDIKAGKPPGRLAGVPFIAKDNFLTFGTKTTAASNMLRDFEAPFQATAIERLEAEGAILVAKSNLDAFAHGSSTEHSDMGPTKNPCDASRVPGGSSGGSAAAVGLGQVPFALGTDTGGSIRLPASFCGVVGYKPTYGLVSRYGVIAMASSTDVVGPLARTVEDAALVLDVLAGLDARDATTIERADSYTKLSPRFKGLKAGLLSAHLGEGVDKNVRAQVEALAEALKRAGADVQEVTVPAEELALAAYYIIVPAEISSNLARYDGIKYGHRSGRGAKLVETYEFSRAEGFNDENKRRVLIGTHVLSSGYYDAYYKQAQTARTKIIRGYESVFEQVDVLIGPTAPTPAFKLGEKIDDPVQMYLSDIMTVGASLAGLPAASVPIGKVGDLPVGLQIIGAQRQDRQVLAAARAVEQLTGAGG